MVETGNVLQRSTGTRSSNNCCSGKAIGIKYSECVFAELGIRHAMRVCHIVICGLSGSAVFFYTIS